LIRCSRISKSFGGLKAVNLTWPAVEFEPGKVTAVIGPNGAGKTTLFHLMGGTLRPDSGTITYRGKRLDGLKPWDISRMGVGRLFQDVRVFERMTALENLLAAFPAQPGENPFYAVFRASHVRTIDNLNRDTAAGLLERVGLRGFENALAGELSYGQQKLLAIARLMAADADALLLDEPTAGVNPAMIGVLQSIIRDLGSAGRTVVVIEHNMDVVLAVADWVLFMDEGDIVLMSTPEDVLSDPGVRAAYLGM